VSSFELLCIQPVRILVGASKEHMLGFDIWWLLHVFLLRDVPVQEVGSVKVKQSLPLGQKLPSLIEVWVSHMNVVEIA